MVSKKSDTSTQKNEVNNKKATSSCYTVAILFNFVLIAIIAYLLNLILSKQEKTFTDCTDYFSAGHRENGIYEIRPTKDSKFNVYCNMTAGGWTAIMRRDLDINKLDFYHDITRYKQGFGDLLAEHFLGLDFINILTTVKDRQLMLVINDTQYRLNNFKVLNEFYHYKIVIMDEIDRMPDGTSLLRLNNTMFSTSDVDFDLAANGNCSTGYKCGWWFTDCYDQSICMTGMSMHSKVGVKKFTYSSMLIK